MPILYDNLQLPVLDPDSYMFKEMYGQDRIVQLYTKVTGADVQLQLAFGVYYCVKTTPPEKTTVMTTVAPETTAAATQSTPRHSISSPILLLVICPIDLMLPFSVHNKRASCLRHG